MALPATALGRLAPVDWPGIVSFAQKLSEFCKVHLTPDRVLTTAMEAGEIELRWRAGVAQVRLSSQNDEGLQNLRDTLGHLLDVASEGLAAGLSWHSGTAEGQPPPNFRLARVASSHQISPRFQRLRLVAEDIGFLARTGLHLRLLQPKDPRNPQWPRLSANGRTLWPGDAHLHMPVYTIRAIDADAGWLDVDVFLHGNGPTCAWARNARSGDAVGLTGPGGGWLPDASRLCLGGDETALPVLARILESAAPETTGQALIEVADESEIQPMRTPQGLHLHWLRRGRDPSLCAVFAETAARMIGTAPGTQILFGGEKSDAQAIRSVLRETEATDRARPGVARRLSVAAYWTASA
jgi:NADPH-dependent ferric siderophore reductase